MIWFICLWLLGCVIVWHDPHTRHERHRVPITLLWPLLAIAILAVSVVDRQ